MAEQAFASRVNFEVELKTQLVSQSRITSDTNIVADLKDITRTRARGRVRKTEKL